MPDSASLTPQSLDEQTLQDTSLQSIWDRANSSTVMTPKSSTTPFSRHHLGNPNLPDMKPVMFPSDNPFAYPNQPLSTFDQQSAYSSPAGSGMYNIASTQPSTNMPFDDARKNAFGGSFSIPQHYMETGQQLNAPLSGATGFDSPQTIEGNGDMTGINFPGGEGYWTQMDRINGSRIGLIPGGINIDELFGGEGWSNIWNNQSLGR